MAIISEFQEDEAPRQQPQAALASALEQSGGAAVFLQAAINVARQRSDFFSDSSAVSKITAMASTARAQVEAEEGEAKRKAQESERKVAEAETAAKAAAAPPPPPVRMEKAKSSVEKKDSNVRREYSILFEIDLLRTAF
jgi:7-keto-8-aminopelargonate synthetase-like enzyme